MKLESKNRLDMLCDIEEFTNCTLDMAIDEAEADKPFWKETYVSVESVLLEIEKHRDYGNGNLEKLRDVLLKEGEEKQ